MWIKTNADSLLNLNTGTRVEYAYLEKDCHPEASIILVYPGYRAKPRDDRFDIIIDFNPDVDETREVFDQIVKAICSGKPLFFINREA